MSSDAKNNLKFLVALANFQKFGPVRLKKIKKHFPSLENAFNGRLKNLMAAGIEENVVNEFIAARSGINPDEIMERLAKENVSVLTVEDGVYPKLLKEIYDPPEVLYYKGNLEEADEFSLAVVGSRKFTSYGKMATEKITADLARSHLTIVSGLALGIDALAHFAALNADGRTIAVLGSGLDKQNIYPSANRYLADKIVGEGGALISEFPLGMPALPHHFPQRNRIISGLSLGTLVIEAGEKSGSLITAKFALEQGREVFAVPGNIYSLTSAGTNQLIKQGAHPVTGAADIIEALDLANVASFVETKKVMPETPEEKKIAACLDAEPLHVNDLVRLAGLDTSQINATLTIMEMKGMIKNMGNMTYIIIK